MFSNIKYVVLINHNKCRVSDVRIRIFDPISFLPCVLSCGVYSDSLQLDLWTQLGFYMHTLPQNKVSRKAYFYDVKIVNAAH